MTLKLPNVIKLTFVNTIAFLPSGPEPTMYNVRMA